MIWSDLLAAVKEMLAFVKPALAVVGTVLSMLLLWTLFVIRWLERRLGPLEASVASLLGAEDRPGAGGDFEFRLGRLERLSDDWVSDLKERHDEDAAALLGSLLEISEAIRGPGGAPADRRNAMRGREA